MKHLADGAGSQDDRVFKIFFTIGFAGELATRYGITEWPVGEALSAALRCFNDWPEDKGGLGNQEEKQALEQIRYFFSTYAQSKFKWIVNGKTADDTNLNERAGYMETKTDADSLVEDVYYVFPEYFKNIVPKGLNLKTTTKMLIDEGILEPENSKIK